MPDRRRRAIWWHLEIPGHPPQHAAYCPTHDHQVPWTTNKSAAAALEPAAVEALPLRRTATLGDCRCPDAHPCMHD